jgi:hypothetical protein
MFEWQGASRGRGQSPAMGVQEPLLSPQQAEEGSEQYMTAGLAGEELEILLQRLTSCA